MHWARFCTTEKALSRTNLFSLRPPSRSPLRTFRWSTCTVTDCCPFICCPKIRTPESWSSLTECFVCPTRPCWNRCLLSCATARLHALSFRSAVLRILTLVSAIYLTRTSWNSFPLLHLELIYQTVLQSYVFSSFASWLSIISFCATFWFCPKTNDSIQNYEYNVYHRAFLSWNFQRGLSGFKTDLKPMRVRLDNEWAVK